MDDIKSILILDIDGTLADSVVVHQQAFEAALRTFAFPNLRTDWASYLHHSDSAIFAEAWRDADFQGKPDKERLESAYKIEFDRLLKNRPVNEIDGARNFLRSVKDSSWNIGFATGGLRYGAIRKLEALGIDSDNSVLVTASEYETREDIVAQTIAITCERYGIPSSARVVSIGDGIWDFLTAQALGLDFLGIGDGHKADALRALGATVFKDFANQAAIHDALSGRSSAAYAGIQ